MDRPSIELVCALAEAIVAAPSMEAVRHILDEYDTDEIAWERLLIEIKALSRVLH